MKKILIILLACSLGFVSCKKKDKEPTKTELLQNGKWKLTAANAGALYDFYPKLKDCMKDNIYTFNTDKTISVDEGATKCDASSAQTYTEGNWALESSDTKIIITGGTITAGLGSLSGTVVSLTSTTLQVSKDTSISGYSTTINVTFTNTK